MIKDLPEGETQYDHFDELIAQLRVARDNFYRSKAMEVASLREECETLRRELATAKEIPMKYKRMEFNAQLQNELAAMTAERDTYKQLASNCGLLEDQVRTSYDIAAEQAYSQQLREELAVQANWHAGYGEQHLRKSADKALAIPHDDTALRQYGAKLLRDAGEREDEVERARRLV